MKKSIQVSVRFTPADLHKMKQIIEVHEGYSISDESNSKIVAEAMRIAIKRL